MSNAGPLTTTFTAPSNCATATGLYQIWGDDDTDYYYEQGPLADRTDCFPDGYDAAPSQYYSPGVCPHGYTAACSSTEVASPGAATETAYTCCPTAADYTCAGGNAASQTLASGGQQQQYLGCTTTFGHAVAVAGATAISGGSTYPAAAVTEPAGQGVGANSIAVRFRSGDFAATTATTGGSGGQAGATSATAALSLATPPAPQPSQTSHSGASSSNTGLSTAGIAGIGAGSVAGALMLASIFGLFWLRRRRRTRKQHGGGGGGGGSKAQLRGRRPPPPPRGFHPPPPSFSPSSSAFSTPRGPPPPRPPRPYPGPPLSSSSSSSSSRDRKNNNTNKVYDYHNWPYSPSLAPSDEDTYIDDNENTMVYDVDEVQKSSKQLCATTTTIRNVKNMALVNGPFELDSFSIDADGAANNNNNNNNTNNLHEHAAYYEKSNNGNQNNYHQGKGSLHELYGSNHDPVRSNPPFATTPSSPPPPAIAGAGSRAGEMISSWGQRQQPRSPPPAYGYGGGGGGVEDYYHQQQQHPQQQQQQPQHGGQGQNNHNHRQKKSIYELETPPKALRSPTSTSTSQRHRRKPSERLGTMWAPAELASQDATKFL